MLKDQRGRYMQGWQLMPLLGFKPGDHLPKEGFICKVVELPDGQCAAFECLPANGGKHRIRVRCVFCCEFIPFGRAGQHIPSCKRKFDAEVQAAAARLDAEELAKRYNPAVIWVRED